MNTQVGVESVSFIKIQNINTVLSTYLLLRCNNNIYTEFVVYKIKLRVLDA